MRLLAMVEPILGVFEEIVTTWRDTRCEACGKPTGDPGPVIAVGRLVLDRAGFHPSVQVEVARTPQRDTPITVAELEDKMERVQAAFMLTLESQEPSGPIEDRIRKAQARVTKAAAYVERTQAILDQLKRLQQTTIEGEVLEDDAKLV
jgi:hypothetical protein